LRGVGKIVDKGRYPLSLGKECIKHILFGCPETGKMEK
jgi:hypothetical protein